VTASLGGVFSAESVDEGDKWRRKQTLSYLIVQCANKKRT
jgi:hypothetical protein